MQNFLISLTLQDLICIVLPALTSAVLCNFFIERFCRMAMLENQLEVFLYNDQIDAGWCYRIVDCFRSYLPSPCHVCKKTHYPWHFFSFTSLFSKCPSFSTSKLLATETLFLLLYFLFFQQTGFNIFFLVFCIIFPLFYIITIVDFRYFIIPDELNFLGLFLGLFFHSSIQICSHFKWLPAHPFFKNIWFFSLKNSLIGMLMGAGLLYSIAWLVSLLLNREAMGFGDIKLMAFIGAFLGYKTTLITLGLSSVLGSFFGIFFMIKSKYFDKRQGFTMIAFGPYIILATLIVMYTKETVFLNWFQSFSIELVNTWVH